MKERLVMAHGNLFAVTRTTGDIAPAGARELGLYHEDTRHLSHYELRLAAGAPTELSADSISAVLTQIDLTASAREAGALVDEPINVLHVRRKQLLDRDFVDQLVLTNYLGHDVDLDFEVRFAADFVDIFEVRGAKRDARGELQAPIVGEDRVELRYLGRDGLTYRTLVRFTPAPRALDGGAARFRIRLSAGESRVQEILVTPTREGADGPPVGAPIPFDVRAGHARGDARRFQRHSTGVRSDNRIFVAALDRALADVHALRVEHDGRWVVGAGIPWFAAPFGRDSLIVAMQMLAFAPMLAGETLRFLARYQGIRIDRAREEEPGKIMHELRRGEMARTGEIPHSPYFGSIDATPLFVMCAGETWRWQADRELLTELWPHVKAAMRWIEARTDGGTGLLAYRRQHEKGLDNQGWKDSRDGVSFPDGRRADPPIALVEVQGYVVDAHRHAARMAEAMGEPALADVWRERIVSLTAQIEARFWNERVRGYALAIDGTGAQVPTLTSNPGHLLWTRAISPERAARVAGSLLAPEMYSGWGIRTASRGQPVYNPISYHNGTIWPHDNAICALGMARYGLHAEALLVLDGLLDATRAFRHLRLPELFCGMGRGEGEVLVQYPVSCSPQAWASGALFMALQAALGLDPDAHEGRLRIHNPMLPESVRTLELRRMAIGRSSVSLRFQRNLRRTHVDVLETHGERLRVEIDIG